MQLIKSVTIASWLVLFGGWAFAASYPQIIVPEPGSPKPGVWTASYVECQQLAAAAKVPMLTMVASFECSHCKTLEAEMTNSASAFLPWMKAHPEFYYCIVITNTANFNVYMRGETRALSTDTAAAFKFTGSGTFPRMGLEWCQETGETRKWTFAGTTGMAGKSWVGTKGTTLTQTDKSLSLSAQLVSRLEAFTADFKQERQQEFACGNTATDGLQAEPTTGTVWVPVVATKGLLNTNDTYLVVDYGAAIQTTRLSWRAGQITNYVPVATSTHFTIGGLIGLELRDENQELQATNSIRMVAKLANGVANPYWVGEKSADTLAFTDWTLDYATAKLKFDNGDADYLLAYYSGVQWCPYCQGMENSLFGSSAWTDWLNTESVQPVLFDQDLSPTDAYPWGAGLLTYLAGEEHISAAGSRAKVSGAGYLSRHSLKADDPEVVAVHQLSISNSWTNWKAPESTATRMSTPSLLLIGHNGKVLGRFNAWRDRNGLLGTDLKYYDPEENIARLNDLLKLASRQDESSGYRTLTSLEHAVGSTSRAELQVNAATAYYQLDDFTTGDLTITAATNGLPVQIKLAIWSQGQEVATGVGTVAVRLTQDMVTADDLALAVSVPDYTDTKKNLRVSELPDGTSVVQVEFSSSLKPLPFVDKAELPLYFESTQVLEELDVSATAKVSVRVKSGKLPSGMKLGYDAATASVVVYGVAKWIGTSEFSYQVTINDGGVKTISELKTVTLTVYDASWLNPLLGEKLAATVPLLVTRSDSSAYLAGTLTLSVTAKNKYTAKFAGSNGAKQSFSGNWQQVESDGQVSGTAINRNGTSMTLSLDTAGLFKVELAGMDEIECEPVLTGSCRPLADATPYAGYYTVQLPCTNGFCAGTGYLTLTMTSASALRTGKVQFAGVLPNGTTISGSTTLSMDANDLDRAVIPILKTSSREQFAALLTLEPYASQEYGTYETARTIATQDGVEVRWQHTESNYAFEAELEAWGGYYAKGTALVEWLAMDEYVAAPLTLTLVPEVVRDSEKHGRVVSFSSGIVEIKGLSQRLVSDDSNLKFSFAKSTGLISGKAAIEFEDGSVIKGNYKGVATPGWSDCGCFSPLKVLPFASGTFYYSDKVGSRTVKRSVPVDLLANGARE